MKLTIVGSGDAFSTGGRANTCLLLQSAKAKIVIDFGAGSMLRWKELGLSLNDVDVIVISHLHGDHFGGLPFVLLESQFVTGRTRPLRMIGPPGFRQRLQNLLETFFPSSLTFKWNFDWPVEEITARQPVAIADLTIETFEVPHASGSLSTGVRASDGDKVFAFSGDSAWTENLVSLSANADLFLLECYSGGPPVPGHMDWPTLQTHLREFTARAIVLTHLGETSLPKIPEMEAAGLMIAADGKSFDL